PDAGSNDEVTSATAVPTIAPDRSGRPSDTPSLGRPVGHTAILWGVANCLQRLISFAASVALSRILLPEHFGILATAGTLQAWGATMTEFGFETLPLSQRNTSREMMGTHLALRMATAAFN